MCSGRITCADEKQLPRYFFLRNFFLRVTEFPGLGKWKDIWNNRWNWTVSSSVQVMNGVVFCPCGTKPLPKPMFVFVNLTSRNKSRWNWDQEYRLVQEIACVNIVYNILAILFWCQCLSWPRVSVYVSVTNGSDNGLSPARHQVIICTSAGLLLSETDEQILVKFQSN